MTLPAITFIRCLLSHGLPDNFVRIHHFGLHHSSCRPKLQLARRLLSLPFQLPTIAKLKFLDWFKQISKSDDNPRLCKFCGIGMMLPIREFGPAFDWRLRLHTFPGLLTSWRNAFA